MQALLLGSKANEVVKSHWIIWIDLPKHAQRLV